MASLSEPAAVSLIDDTTPRKFLGFPRVSKGRIDLVEKASASRPSPLADVSSRYPSSGQFAASVQSPPSQRAERQSSATAHASPR